MTVTMDVGVLHDEAFARDPLPAWRRLRDEHPFFHDTVEDVHVLSRHEDVRWGFTEAQGVSLINRVYARTVGKVFGSTFLEMDGREHVQRRKVVAPQFVGNRLEKYLDIIDGVAAEIVDECAAEGTFDIVERVAHRVPGTVIATMLGLPREDLPAFFGWYNAMMQGFWTDPELRRRGHQAHLDFQDYLAPILAERSEHPGADLISRVIHAEVEGDRVAPDEVGSFLSLLLVAGGETTDKAIGNLWGVLLTHPDEYAACREDPARLDVVFSEVMRLYPSLIYLGREVIEPFERHGHAVAPGDVVRLNVASANRDERVFVEPDRFWPDRPDLHLGLELRAAPFAEGRASHLAFGAGSHFCIGYQLARAEALATARHLLRVLGPRPEAVDLVPPRTAPPSRSTDRLVVRCG
jgi:pulcherriminic acid synthase